MSIPGPVFYADLRSNSRRGRLIFIRILLLILLFIIFYFSYEAMASVMGAPSYGFGIQISVTQLQQAALSQFANNFVFTLLLVLFVLLLVIGPVYVSSAIAEEKQRGTLEYLLASQLNDAEIIFGKFCSRFLLLFQFVLIVIPIIALTQFLGGISMQMTAGIVMAMAGVTASLTAISLWLSVLCQRGRDALVRTYLFLLIFCMIWLGLYELVTGTWFTAWWISIAGLESLAWLNDLLFLNPFYVALRLREALNRMGEIGTLPLRWFGLCCLLHLLIALFFLILSERIFRKRHLRQIDRDVKRAKKITQRRRPEIGERDPLLWKERYLEGGWQPLHWLIRSFRQQTSWAVIGTASLLAVAIILMPFLSLLFLDKRAVELFFYGLMWCFIGAFILGLAAAILRTASSIGVEKEKQTWEMLLASPLSTSWIVAAKVYGGLRSCRWLLIASLVGALLPLFFRRYPPLSLSLALATVCYFWFALALASFYSVKDASAVRCVMKALGTFIVISVFPLLIATLLPSGNIGDVILQLVLLLSGSQLTFTILGVGLFSILCVVIYKFIPRAWWLIAIVQWLGTLLAINFAFLLLLSGLVSGLGFYIKVSTIASFFSPIACYGGMLMSYLYSPVYHLNFRHSIEARELGVFIVGSGLFYLLAGLALFSLAQWRLRRLCGRIDHSGKKDGRLPKRLRG